MLKRDRRRKGWMIVREGGGVAWYFRGALFGEDEAWTRNPEYAYQFLKRAAARWVLTSNVARHRHDVRIVPIWMKPEGWACSLETPRSHSSNSPAR